MSIGFNIWIATLPKYTPQPIALRLMGHGLQYTTLPIARYQMLIEALYPISLKHTRRI